METTTWFWMGWDGISACPECCSLSILQVEPTNMGLDIRHARSHLDLNYIITDTRRLFLQNRQLFGSKTTPWLTHGGVFLHTKQSNFFRMEDFLVSCFVQPVSLRSMSLCDFFSNRSKPHCRGLMNYRQSENQMEGQKQSSPMGPPPRPHLTLTLDDLGAKEKGEIIKSLVKS